ncbi:MAG: thioredoxin family protein [bacterium]
MKQFLRYVVLAAVVVTVFGARVGTAEKAEQLGMTWYTTLEEGIQAAAVEKKPVFVDFWDVRSKPYKQQFEETYKDPRVKAMFSKFVLVTLNIVKRYDVARQLRVSQVPTILFLDQTGKELGRHRLEQYVAPEFLAECMEGVLGDLKALEELKEKARNEPDNLDTVLGIGKVLKDWYREEEAIPYFQRVADATDADPKLREQARDGWAQCLLVFGNRRGLHGDTDVAIRSLKTFLELFPKHERTSEAQYMLALYLIDTGKNDEAAEILKKIQQSAKGDEAKRAEAALRALNKTN